MDLEAYRRANGLSYRKLAEHLAISQGRRAMAIAKGECWPDADRLADIVARTDGKVTIEAMHERRLRWLVKNRGVTIGGENGEDMTVSIRASAWEATG